MGWLADFYHRRVVNVNVNIVLAGLLSLAPTTYIVHLTRHLLSDDQKFLISGITFLADIIFDVVIYYFLHWFANHMPRKGRWVHPAYEGLTFVRDATLVQFERAIISPVLYTVALGSQTLLMHRGTSREWATVIGFVGGIAAARCIHTVWMLRSERKAMARHQAKLKTGEATATAPEAPAPAPAPLPREDEPQRRVGGAV